MMIFQVSSLLNHLPCQPEVYHKGPCIIFQVLNNFIEILFHPFSAHVHDTSAHSSSGPYRQEILNGK